MEPPQDKQATRDLVCKSQSPRGIRNASSPCDAYVITWRHVAHVPAPGLPAPSVQGAGAAGAIFLVQRPPAPPIAESIPAPQYVAAGSRGGWIEGAYVHAAEAPRRDPRRALRGPAGADKPARAIL